MALNGAVDVSNTDKDSLKLVFKSLMKEAADKAEELNRRNPKKVLKGFEKRRHSIPRNQKHFKNPRRSSRLEGRSPSKVDSEVDLDVSEEESDTNLAKVFKPRIKLRNSISAPPPKAVAVEEITEDMIRRIHRQGLKEYNSARGILCHQCRQKTMDTKTMCRSPRCIGGQGAFCGPCLSNQYGESVEEALKDPNWSCPPCRNICICSRHMNDRGLPPVGVAAPLARTLGYKCVLDYLVSEKTIKLGDEGIILD